jgi:alpha-glucosidase
MDEHFNWWRDGVIYQIYPRSYADSNGDGFGDLPGVTSRLDYLQDLGIDAIWLSPFYPSPDHDFGYDVSDHTAVDPRFGTLEDFDHLLNESHRRGIRVVLDMVLNHTSDQHAWFVESRSSRENPKRDWYIWKDPAPGGKVPNNWQASFGGKAWQWDPASGQYYLHAFLPQQPDINWRNPEARKAQLDVFRFWLERGVDGFRLDVFNAYFKDAAFRNNPPRFGLRGFDRQAHLYDINQPEMLDFLHELRALLDSFPERYAVGETYATPVDQAMKYIGDDRLHTAFTFDFLGSELYSPWNPRWLAKQISQMEKSFTQAGVWPTVVMGNHDQKRVASRITGSRLERGEGDQQALIAMTLLLTLRGTPFLYYGDEIGMRELHLKHAEILDPPGKKYWPFYKGRDGCRSPMQWNAADTAGFSTSKPWLKVHPEFARRNVARQMDDPHSLLSHTRKLIALRRQVTALRQGKLSLHPQEDQQVLVYERSLEDPAHDKQRVLVCLNFSASERRVSLPDEMQNGQVLFSSMERTELAASDRHLQLSPYEVILIKDLQPGG